MRFLFFDKLNANEYAIARVRKWQCRRKPKTDPSATTRLPSSHAHRTAPRASARPRGKARREHTPTNPPALAQYNLARARMHTTARNPIIVKDSHDCRERREARGLPRERTHHNKEGSPPYKRGAPDCLYEKTASRCARSLRYPQSPNRAYRPCRSNRNGRHNSTPALHRPNTSQPGQQR